MTTTKPFLGTVGSFGNAYPGVESLRATVHHNGEVPQAWQRDETYTEQSIPQVIPCLNPRCQQGGFDLKASLITVTHGRATNHKVKLYCGGHEGSPKGRKLGDPCSNSIEIVLQLKFTP